MESGQLLTALQLVELPNVLDNVVEQAHTGLQQLSSTLPGLPDEERKRALLRYLHATRQQLQRLHVAVSWSNKAKAVAEVKRLLEVAANHGSALRDTADQLAFLHGELEDFKAPLYDVPTAVQVLETGSYPVLPTSIEEQAGVVPKAASDARRRAALRRMDFLLRSKLLATQLPEDMVVQRVRDGVAEVAVRGQYSAQLTLVPAPRDEVTLAKYCPPPDVQQPPAGPSVDIEVSQGAAAAGAAGEASAAAAAAAVAAAPMEVDERLKASTAAGSSGAAAGGQLEGRDGGGAAEQGAQREAFRWRWLLVSFKLLPDWQSDTPPLAPNQEAWLQRHLEDKMWRAADVQQLQRLGVASSLLHFPQVVPHGKQGPQQQQQQQQLAALQRPGSAAASMLSTPPVGQAAVAAATTAAVGSLPSEAGGTEGTSLLLAGDAAGQGEGGEVAAPDWALCPLRLMHSVLRQAAGRLTVYSLVLTEARRLEKSSWEGLLRVSRSAGTGLRFAYWLAQPTVTHAELQSLCTQQAGGATAGAAAGTPGNGTAGGSAKATAGAGSAPALDVNVEESGALTVTHAPALYSPQSGQPVQLQLAPTSLSIEQLLQAAAAHNAATQLAAIQCILKAGNGWAPLGISLQLVPPPPSPCIAAADTAGTCPHPALPLLPSAAAAASGGPVLLFRAAGVTAPFLALSLVLKNAKLALAPGPALMESWEGTGAGQPPPSAGGEGPAGASVLEALVAAAQQRVERCQRDALTLPLASAPSSVAEAVQQGGSRGVLAAGLVAAELEALCRRLVRRRRLAEVVAVAQGLGLLPGLPLPLLLLQEHLKQLHMPRPPLASDAVTLALPGFQPPRDMVGWGRACVQRRAAAATATKTIQQHRERLKHLLPLVQTGQAAAAALLARTASIGASTKPAAQVAGGGGESGAVRAHLLVEWVEEEQEGGSAATAPPAGALQQQGSGSGGTSLRLSLVISSCTARGTVKHVLKVVPLPPHLLAARPLVAQAAYLAGHTAAAGAKRKRGAEEDGGAVSKGGDSAWGTGHASAGAARPTNGLEGGRGPGALAPLQAAVRWCREAAVWEQLVVQMQALRVPFSEEWQLGGAAGPPCSTAACQQAGGPSGQPLPGSVLHRKLRLRCPPALASLESWALDQRRVAQAVLASPGSSTGHTACSAAAAIATGGWGPAVDWPRGEEPRRGALAPGLCLELDPCCLEAGAWTTTIDSSYLAQLQQLFSLYHVHVASGPARACPSSSGSGSSRGSMQLTAQGVALHHEQRRGASALTAVTDVQRVLRLHTCVARLASLMLAHPLGPHRNSGSTHNSHDLQTQAASQQQQLEGLRAGPGNGMLAGGSAEDCGTAVPSKGDGCGGGFGGKLGGPAGGQMANGFFIAASANGLTTSNEGLEDVVLGREEGGPGAEGAGGHPGPSKSTLVWLLPLCATVALTEVGIMHAQLVVTPVLPPEPHHQLGQAPPAAPAPPAPVSVRVQWEGRFGSTQASGSSGASGGGGMAPQRDGGFVRCRLSAEPPLPAPLLEALEAQLEAGCEAEFLDALCLAAAPAASLAAVVSPAGLQAAGLLPGAVQLAPAGGGRAPSVLRLAQRAQHLERVLHLQFEFGRGGYTLVRLMGTRNAAIPAWAEAGWARLAQLPACHVAADAAGGMVQAKQAWCGLRSLGDAVGEMLGALVKGDDTQQQ